MTHSVLDLIGNTPILKVTRFDTGLCELYVKLESQNPIGSIKDRVALSLSQAARLLKQRQATRVLGSLLSPL
jgi:cystathionine beta-synthase